MRRTDILASTTSLPARVAKLADARDLKSRVSKETYRFNSGPGHHSKFCPTITSVRLRSVRQMFCGIVCGTLSDNLASSKLQLEHRILDVALVHNVIAAEDRARFVPSPLADNQPESALRSDVLPTL